MKIFIINFKTKSKIADLPYYHGPYFYAMFRNIFDSEIFQYISFIPLTMALDKFLINDKFKCLLLVEDTFSDTISEKLKNFENLSFRGKFSPETLKITGFETFDTDQLIEKDSQNIEKLKNSPSISLSFFTPLRIKRPQGQKKEKHIFFDLEHFYNHKDSINYLLKNIRDLELDENTDFKITDIIGTWVDVPYSSQKTLGGFCGELEILGNISTETLLHLIKGQYLGIGKNRAFGFGFYFVKGIGNVFEDLLEKKRHISQRLCSYKSLEFSLFSLKQTAPGMDDIELNDIISSPTDILKKINKELKKGEYEFKKLKSVSIKKSDNDFRELKIPSVVDRIVEKSIALQIEDIIDKHLSLGVYSYRKRHGIKKAAQLVQNSLKKGYNFAIKGDVKKYFDSIDRESLIKFINVFFKDKGLTKIITDWANHLTNESVSGIPQGSPLSPLLSNLYLDFFDKEILKNNFIYIRYGDDFLIMFQEDIYKDVLELVKEKLGMLNLELKEEKVSYFNVESGIKFLGYLISKEKIVKIDKEDKIEERWKQPITV